MHLCYSVYIWKASQLFINCALVGRCVIVSTTTLEVAGQRSLVLIFPATAKGLDVLSLGKAVWQPHLSAATYKAY